MPGRHIDRLIINSPYEEPGQYWRYERGPGPSIWRRGAGRRARGAFKHHKGALVCFFAG